ncbi:hypothetical protein KEM54_001574 [Ascosphaera aggregata]|nr:hypothetical protein KEM54_001574 [Ascosphaera aggregata]
MSQSRPHTQATLPIPSSSTISAIHTTFHLIFVRNKNQHSHAKWWKYLSLLRRSLRSLLSCLEGLEKYVDGEGIEWSELRMGRGERVVDADGEVVGRDEKVVEVAGTDVKVLENSAFSTVVADTQFSVLGVVLIAALAELADAIKEFATADEGVRVEEESQSEDTMNMSSFETTKKPVKTGRLEEDLGEVIVRQAGGLAEEKGTSSQMVEQFPLLLPGDEAKGRSIELTDETTKTDSEAPILVGKGNTKTKKQLKRSVIEDEQTSAVKSESKRQSAEPEKKEKTKQRKKKKTNAIDDIFGGL